MSESVISIISRGTDGALFRVGRALRRVALAPGTCRDGPAIVKETTSTSSSSPASSIAERDVLTGGREAEGMVAVMNKVNDGVKLSGGRGLRRVRRL